MCQDTHIIEKKKKESVYGIDMKNWFQAKANFNHEENGNEIWHFYTLDCGIIVEKLFYASVFKTSATPCKTQIDRCSFVLRFAVNTNPTPIAFLRSGVT